MPPEDPKNRLLVLDAMTLRRALLARFIEGWTAQNGLDIVLGAFDDLKAQDIKSCALILITVGAAADCEQPLTVASRIAAEHNPDAPLVVIGERPEVGTARRALGVSAAAFIPMTLPEETFFSALDFVRQGGVFYPLDLIKGMVNGPPGSPPRDPWIALPGKALHFPAGALPSRRAGPVEPESLLHPNGLTSRQQQVLDCLRLAWSNKEIARRLDMSEATVKMHVRQLMKKLGASNRTHAAVMALRQDSVILRDALRPAEFALDAAMTREKSRRL